MLHYFLTLFLCNAVAVRSYEFAIRPMYGNPQEGYVEIRINGTWGILPERGATMSAETVSVLCRTFEFGSIGFTTQTYKERNITGHVMFWDRSLNCKGSEVHASECVTGSWTNSRNWISTLPTSTTILHCFAYYVTDIRLYGGVLPHEGRLEVKVGNRWGAVCIHYYDSSRINDEMCSVLGYAEDSAPFTSPNFADNIEPVEDFWMSTLKCYDTDTNINQCRFVKGGYHYCGDDTLVKLKCEPAKIVNGTTLNSGIVEVGLFGKRQMVCGSSSFSTKEANVTCNVLGYRSVGTLSSVKPSIDNTGDVFSGSIQCDGTEQSLEMCDIVQEQSACHDSTVIYIECLGGPLDIIPIENKSNEGIFTMYNWNKLWVVGKTYNWQAGAFSNTTAKTLCYLLGHGYEGSSQYVSYLPGNVSLTPYAALEELDCYGNESDIAQCRRTFFYPCRKCPIRPPTGFVLLYCAECPPGKFGTHCTDCDCTNRSPSPCDTDTGECTCKDGWAGTSCELDIDECVTPTVCPKNSDCTNVPGSYQCVCRLGYSLTDGFCSVSPQKEETEPKSNLLVIILSSVIGGLVLISIIAIVCICTYRMKGQKNTTDSVDATTTNNPSNEFNLSSTNKSDDYSTIDDRSLHTGRELTNTEFILDPYNTIDDEFRGRPGLNQMNMNNNDARQTKDNDYPYPSVLPTDEDGYLKAVCKQTEERKKSPYINADTNYQPLSHQYSSEHDYCKMKR